MKRILLISALLLIGFQPALAVNVKVQAMSDFSTANPAKTWKVKVAENTTLKNGNVLTSGSIIEGRIENVKGPARLKRNATFVFIPTIYHDATTNTATPVKRDFTGKYSTRGDMTVKGVATEGAIIVGNQLANGVVGPAVGLVQGVIKNEEGNRAKSAAMGVYKRTPLSYASKGKDIEVKQGQVFVMSFKEANEPDNEVDEPNYHYTIEE